jgi:hypothetical protein
MIKVSDILKDPWIDGALEQMDSEKSLGIQLVEFSKTIIDRPDTYAKIANSYSGHAADLQIRCVLKELELWCNRLWDKQGRSLPKLAEEIGRKTAELVDSRKRAHPDWPIEMLQLEELPAIISAYEEKIKCLAETDLIQRLRLRRDEHHAHLLNEISALSRQRSKLGLENGYSYGEVLNLAEKSIELISEAIFIWRFHKHDDIQTAKQLSKIYERYWNYIPNLSEIENEERIQRVEKERRRWS